MEATKTQSGTQNPNPFPVDAAMASCRKKKSDDATFLQDVREHIDEFIHASMDEHKTCFKKTIQKVHYWFNAVRLGQYRSGLGTTMILAHLR